MSGSPTPPRPPAKRIAYLCTARLPTEKAHGYQIMQMCEAIAGLGHELELFHPWRYQKSPHLRWTDPFDYYSVAPSFQIRTIASPDQLFSGRRRLLRMFRAALVREFAWTAVAAWKAGRTHPDLMYTRALGPAAWAAWLGFPSVYEVHTVPSGKRARLMRSVSKLDAIRAIFSLTTQAAEDLATLGIPMEKLHVLPDAVDLRRFECLPSTADSRARLGLPLERPIVGYVGRFQTLGKEKGVRELVRAFAAPELLSSNAMLVCVGGPMDVVPAYLELAESLGIPSSSLRFVDRVPPKDVPIWLRALDVAAIPYPEGSQLAPGFAQATSPLKLFEYMAAGAPIVASDLPALRDVLRHEQNALLAPLGDSRALAKAISIPIGDSARALELSKQARRDVHDYTWEGRARSALAAAGLEPGVHDEIVQDPV